jgi:FkbM family methyltransferase
MIIWNDIALIEDDSHFTKWVMEDGRLDHHRGFLDYLQPFLGGAMLDVGANIGTHTAFYAKHGKVLAFEPNPIAFECLHYNMVESKHAKQYKDVTLHNVAVSDKAGHIDLVPQGTNYGAIYTTPGTLIPTITIDSLNLDQCNYIKIDVEGDEIAVLHGAEQTILKHRPVMCIESNPDTLARKGHTVDQLIDVLRLYNYTTKERVPTDISADVLCLPR